MRGYPTFPLTARRWLLTAVLLIIASWLTLLIQSLVSGGRTPFILFFPVVVLAGVYGGLWPAIVSALVGLVVTGLSWRTIGSSPPSPSSAALLLVLFAFSTSVIIAVSVRTRQLLDDHRRFKQQLTEAQASLEIAHVAARMVEWHWDIASGKIELSSSSREVFGISESIDDAWSLVRPAEPHIEDSIKKSLSEGHGYEFASRLIRPNTGEQRWIETQAVIHRNDAGSATRVTGVTIDVTDKYLAAEALRVSEERLRLALEGAQIGIWSMDPSGGVTHSSDTNLAIFGLAEERRVMANSAWATLIHPDDLNLVQNAWREAAQHVRSFAVEYRIKRPDGVERWIHTRGRFRPDTNESGFTGVGVSMDITDRKLAEQARDLAQRSLRDTIEEFETILKLAPVGIVISRDVYGSEIRSNSYADELLNAKGSGVTGDLFSDNTESTFRFVKDSQTLSTADLPLMRAARSGAGTSNELIELFANNERRAEILMSAVPLLDPRGKPRGAVGTMLDITTLRKLEAALQRREEQLRLATDAAEIGFWDVDPIHDTLVWPPRVKAMFGISPDKFISMADFYTGLHPDDRERVVEAFAAACNPEQRALYDTEYRTIGKEDGVIRWVAAKGRGIFNNEGVCVRVIGAAIEISQRKLAEAQLRRLNEHLEQEIQKRTSALLTAEEQLRQAQKMEAIGQLTGGIAHDFNNLLQGVVGTLDLIRRRPNDLQKVRSWAEAGLRAAERGAKLTGQLLTFSRSQKLEIKPFNLSDCLHEMRELLQRSLGPSVKLKLDINDDPNWVLGDLVQTEMAILNLAINARDAMPTGGDLCVSTQRCSMKHDPEISRGSYVLLSVMDSGIGMSSETLARAFDPFFTTKDVGKGTGLGLSQVYGAITQAGGTVRIESRVGEGTTVRMYLPETQVNAIAQTHTAPLADTLLKHVKLLVVDDDSDVRNFLLESLDSLGYDVVGAIDAEEAMAKFDQHGADLVILDFAMPGLNGDVIAQELRLRDPQLPIIFASGYADTAAVMAAVGSEAVVLRKPFSIDELNASIADQLSKRKAPSSDI